MDTLEEKYKDKKDDNKKKIITSITLLFLLIIIMTLSYYSIYKIYNIKDYNSIYKVTKNDETKTIIISGEKEELSKIQEIIILDRKYGFEIQENNIIVKLDDMKDTKDIKDLENIHIVLKKEYDSDNFLIRIVDKLDKYLSSDNMEIVIKIS